MSYPLSKLVSVCKRRGQYGDINNTSDQVTQDILDSYFERASRLWRAWDWDFSLQEISETLVAGTADYTLSVTNIGKIILLFIDGQDDHLRPLTLKRYHQWARRKGEGNGEVTHYVKLGRSSAGAFKLKLYKTPADAGTLEGYGKKKLSRYVLADIAANTGIEYFPDDYIDVIITGILSDIAEIKGNKVEAQAKEALFVSKMAELIPDEANQPDEEWSSPPPDRYINAKRSRGGTRVVT